MPRTRMELEGAKKAFGVHTDIEAEKILNHGVIVEDYPSTCTIIEKVIVEDRNGDTRVQSIKARGRIPKIKK